MQAAGPRVQPQIALAIPRTQIYSPSSALDGSSPRHLQDEAPTSILTKATNNQITEKMEDLHAPDDNATVEIRWWLLRNVIQSTAFEVLGHARRRHQDWFDDKDADISNLLAEKNRLRP
ncbi:unnamed protein product [Schistocephalus solidus]|uniref:Uncharacterized protein n=1 Tax=Schistocephalus solidus TaxID=70667 RepID=A0A183SUM7_SCHSO|nr:unnamed protein product [Schistocephalus solidus]